MYIRNLSTSRPLIQEEILDKKSGKEKYLGNVPNSDDSVSSFYKNV